VRYAGKLDIAPLITHRFKAKQLAECYERLDGGEQKIVGAVFSWD
jgi:threonine dehydrogenase-like Zn-dependent dehydrogenase